MRKGKKVLATFLLFAVRILIQDLYSFTMLGLSTNSVYLILILAFLVILVLSVLAQNRFRIRSANGTEDISQNNIDNTASETVAPKNTLNDFRYPGSELVSASFNNLILQSSDDVNAVTDWYANKIRDLNLNSVSKILTNSNDNILKTISASSSNQSVYIQITKRSGSNTTKITVER